ncbi:MAG TPA: hypothetical protein VHF58_11065 [Solirubrobacterales bacterium]|nr:hypothetical protein [Solirubrobacterales bacterium]
MTSATTNGAGIARPLAAALAFGRIGIGLSVWAIPRGSMRVLGFDPDNPEVMALARLAGTRDLALGAGAAATLDDPAAAATMLRVNAAVDAGDALAFGIALLRRRGIDRAALVGTATAAGAAAVALAVAKRVESDATRAQI